jgi:hypothetical protein
VQVSNAPSRLRRASRRPGGRPCETHYHPRRWRHAAMRSVVLPGSTGLARLRSA